MQSLRLPPYVFAAEIERDLVLFDSGADRYVALPGALCDRTQDGIDIGLAGSLVVREAAEMLVGAQFLGDTRENVPVVRTAAKPSRLLPTASRPTGASLMDVVRIASAIVQTHHRLKRGLPCREFTRTRRHRSILSMRSLEEATGRLRAARLAVPHPRRCLPDSIVAALFLRKLGHEVEIVFGVRSHPFEAHCWIEADGVVLDDELDRVRAFTPIAVGQL